MRPYEEIMTDKRLMFKKEPIELSGNETANTRDLRIVAQAVNQHAKYIEELIQRVKELEGEKEKEAEK